MLLYHVWIGIEKSGLLSTEINVASNLCEGHLSSICFRAGYYCYVMEGDLKPIQPKISRKPSKLKMCPGNI